MLSCPPLFRRHPGRFPPISSEKTSVQIHIIIKSILVSKELNPTPSYKALILSEFTTARENWLETSVGDSNKGVILNIGGGRVVKRVKSSSLSEAIAMEFVRRSTAIPIPALHTAFQHTDGFDYIVMDLVDGEPLSKYALPKRDENHKIYAPDVTVIVHQLQDYIRQLKYIGSGLNKKSLSNFWPEGPFRNVHFLKPIPEEEFYTMSDFYTYWTIAAQQTTYDITPEMLNGLFLPTLSHGDFTPQNILVKDGSVVAVLDWETFGWYPDFWDEMMLAGRALAFKGSVKHISETLPSIAPFLFRLFIASIRL